MSAHQTRACLLTPAGTAAIAAIQVSGPDALHILGRMFRSRQLPDATRPEPGRLYFGRVADESDTIDDVIVSCVSLDGNWMVEIQCHGGLRVCERILQLASTLGAVTSESTSVDEVTFQAGVLEREIYDALRLAATWPVAEWLLGVQEGLSSHVRKAIRCLNEQSYTQLPAMLDILIRRQAAARLLLHGAGITLIGPPNAGKSTLANALVGADASIVSPYPGTTRDWVMHLGHVNGLPVRVTDTAGLRETDDVIERESVDRAMRQAGAADLVLFVADRSCSWSKESEDLIANRSTGTACVLVATKCDLPAGWDLRDRGRNPLLAQVPMVEVCALNGQGLACLRSAILTALGLGEWHSKWPAIWTSRQQDLCQLAANCLSENPARAIVSLETLIS